MIGISAPFSRILSAKKRDPESRDTTLLGQEIDWMVYELYNLTEEENTIMEGTSS